MTYLFTEKRLHQSTSTDMLFQSLSYQLGNLVSSASSTIEATIGERFPLPPLIEDGEEIPRYEYGKVM